jgi:hypothetical protein
MGPVNWGVFIRDKCTCRYCGLSGRDNFAVWRQLHLDHIVPKGLVPDKFYEAAENKVVACSHCNTLKSRVDKKRQREQGAPSSSLTWEEFLAKVKEYKAQAESHLEERRIKDQPEFKEMMVQIGGA